MPSTPDFKYTTLTNSSVDVLNVIRENATVNYRDYVPVATPDAEVIREIGAIIMDMPALQNEFISALINRIGKVIVTSKLYYNNLAKFKKGTLEYGETIEEIFAELAKPFQFDPEASVTNVYARQIPDVRSAFHILNYQKFYKQTISQAELRQAFLSIEGVTDLINKIVEAMYTAAAYDEQQVMLYMIAKNLENGRIVTSQINSISNQNSDAIVTSIKAVANKLSFMSPDYNVAGVRTFTPLENQHILISAEFDAIMGVNTLASAFNMDQAQFLGQRTMVKSFGGLDTARLAELFAGDPTYTKISDDVLQQLDTIPCIVLDDRWFQVYDKLATTKTKENEEGLYWNYWYHTWKVFSVSPFAQCVAFVPTAQTVTKVTVSPKSATLARTGAVQLTADVQTTGFASQEVDWSSNQTGVVVSKGGLVTVTDKASTSQITATITATSVVDSAKKDTATITVPANS